MQPTLRLQTKRTRDVDRIFEQHGVQTRCIWVAHIDEKVGSRVEFHQLLHGQWTQVSEQGRLHSSERLNVHTPSRSAKRFILPTSC